MIRKPVFKKYFKTAEWINPIAVTLTMKQRINGECLDEIASSRNMRNFLNRLNYQIYGNSFKRFGKQINVLPVLEWDANHRFHYHLIIDRPDRINFLKLDKLITECWKKTKFGYHQIKINQDIDDGWLDYILKERSKTDLPLSIDWDNTSLNRETSLN